MLRWNVSALRNLNPAHIVKCFRARLHHRKHGGAIYCDDAVIHANNTVTFEYKIQSNGDIQLLVQRLNQY